MTRIRRGVAAAAITVTAVLAGASTVGASDGDASAAPAGDVAAARSGMTEPGVELGASLAAATALALGLACVAATRRDEPRRERINW